MATEILSLAAGSKSAGILLRALDYQQNEFLDILIELEQKEVRGRNVDGPGGAGGWI